MPRANFVRSLHQRALPSIVYIFHRFFSSKSGGEIREYLSENHDADSDPAVEVGWARRPFATSSR